MSTFNDLASRAAKSGFLITDAQRAEIEAAKDAARASAESDLKHQLEAMSRLERAARVFNQAYAPALNGVIRAGDLIVTIVNTFIVAFGSPIAWVLVFLVEIGRVAAGVSLFISDPTHALEAAVALIIVNTVFEVSIHFQDRRTGHKQAPETLFSFRLVGARIAYLFGGKGWQPQYKLDNGRSRQRAATWTILAITTLGAVQPLIEAAPGNWRNGLVNIFYEATLAQMLGVIGNIALGWTLIITGQHLARFMVLLSLETIDGLAAAATASNRIAAEAAEKAAHDTLLAQYRTWLRQRETVTIGNVQPPLVSGVSGVSSPTEKQETEERRKALEWYRADLSRLKGTHREDCKVIGVSESTAYRAKKTVLDEQPTEAVSVVSDVSETPETRNAPVGPDEPIPPTPLVYADQK